MFSKDLGIDLGTMFTRLADSTQVLSEEPTIVAIEVADQKMVAVGQEARDMYGRVPESIEVARPLKNGVIADYEITETLLSYLLQRVSGSMRWCSSVRSGRRCLQRPTGRPIRTPVRWPDAKWRGSRSTP